MQVLLQWEETIGTSEVETNRDHDQVRDEEKNIKTFVN